MIVQMDEQHPDVVYIGSTSYNMEQLRHRLRLYQAALDWLELNAAAKVEASS